MQLLVSQRFSNSSLRKISGQWVARESWNVVGTLDKNVAIEAACPFNTPHLDNLNMRAGVRDAVNHKGPASWIVTGDFTFGDHGACANSPIDEPPTIMAEPGIEMVPGDTDIDNAPITNSAGDPFDPPPSTPVHTFSLIVRKALPFYPVQTAIQITNAVNSDPFTLRGAGGVDPGQCLCRYMKPFEPYTEFAPYVWVEFSFAFADAQEPWQQNLIDKGQNGWFEGDSAPQKSYFCFADGTPCNTDILLDGTGKPISPEIFVADDNGTAVVPRSNPNATNTIRISQSLSSPLQTTLLWRVCKAFPFTGLI